MTQWPIYIDPISGEKLLEKKNKYNQLHLTSKNGVSYPIIKGIPRILKDFNNYSSAFGEQWTKWRKTQLDTYTNTTITRDRLFRCLGKNIIYQLKNSKDIIHVLEVGCGAGRFTEILLEFPSIKLTSIDLSYAVEANLLNFPQNSHHRIIQTDLMELPFKSMQYDLSLIHI